MLTPQQRDAILKIADRYDLVPTLVPEGQAPNAEDLLAMAREAKRWVPNDRAMLETLAVVGE